MEDGTSALSKDADMQFEQVRAYKGLFAEVPLIAFCFTVVYSSGRSSSTHAVPIP